MDHDDRKGSRRDQEIPNRESNMEPAEGSRENAAGEAETATAGNQGGRGTSTMKKDERGRSEELPSAAFGEEHGDEDAGGISNRPRGEEERRQDNIPPRGERRENWKED